MSNLKDYQKITTIAKKVGGVKKLLGIVVGGTVVATLAVEKIVVVGKNKITEFVKKKKRVNLVENEIDSFKVDVYYNDEKGLELNIGDIFQVLESDNDVILIEVLENNNNPYFLSKQVLMKISSEYSEKVKEELKV